MSPAKGVKAATSTTKEVTKVQSTPAPQESVVEEEEVIPPKIPLRWGIVAVGKCSHDFVNAFNSYPDIGDQVIAAVAARDKQRARVFALKHNIERVFDNYNALATSDAIDVAYIATLTPQHFSLAKLFLTNGKHVLCEKPFCLNHTQTETLVNLAKEKKLFLMEAFWTRFSPAYVDLEKDLNEGKIGDIKLIEGNFGIVMDEERIFNKESGGGAALEIGVYLLYLAQFVFKEEPRKITAVGSLLESGVDENETIILDYGKGRRAVFNVYIKFQLCNRLIIYGTNGRIEIEYPFEFPEKVIDVDGVVRQYSVHHTATLPYNYGNNRGGLVYQALEVCRCIENGLIESPCLPHKEIMRLANLVQEVRMQLGVHYKVDDESACYCPE